MFFDGTYFKKKNHDNANNNITTEINKSGSSHDIFESDHSCLFKTPVLNDRSTVERIQNDFFHFIHSGEVSKNRSQRIIPILRKRSYTSAFQNVTGKTLHPLSTVNNSNDETTTINSTKSTDKQNLKMRRSSSPRFIFDHKTNDCQTQEIVHKSRQGQSSPRSKNDQPEKSCLRKSTSDLQMSPAEFVVRNKSLTFSKSKDIQGSYVSFIFSDVQALINENFKLIAEINTFLDDQLSNDTNLFYQVLHQEVESLNEFSTNRIRIERTFCFVWKELLSKSGLQEVLRSWNVTGEVFTLLTEQGESVLDIFDTETLSSEIANQSFDLWDHETSDLIEKTSWDTTASTSARETQATFLWTFKEIYFKAWSVARLKEEKELLNDDHCFSPESLLDAKKQFPTNRGPKTSFLNDHLNHIEKFDTSIFAISDRYIGPTRVKTKKKEEKSETEYTEKDLPSEKGQQSSFLKDENLPLSNESNKLEAPESHRQNKMISLMLLSDEKVLFPSIDRSNETIFQFAFEVSCTPDTINNEPEDVLEALKQQQKMPTFSAVNDYRKDSDLKRNIHLYATHLGKVNLYKDFNRTSEGNYDNMAVSLHTKDPSIYGQNKFRELQSDDSKKQFRKFNGNTSTKRKDDKRWPFEYFRKECRVPVIHSFCSNVSKRLVVPVSQKGFIGIQCVDQDKNYYYRIVDIPVFNTKLVEYHLSKITDHETKMKKLKNGAREASIQSRSLKLYDFYQYNQFAKVFSNLHWNNVTCIDLGSRNGEGKIFQKTAVQKNDTTNLSFQENHCILTNLNMIILLSETIYKDCLNYMARKYQGNSILNFIGSFFHNVNKSAATLRDICNDSKLKLATRWCNIRHRKKEIDLHVLSKHGYLLPKNNNDDMTRNNMTRNNMTRNNMTRNNMTRNNNFKSTKNKGGKNMTSKCSKMYRKNSMTLFSQYKEFKDDHRRKKIYEEDEIINKHVVEQMTSETIDEATRRVNVSDLDSQGKNDLIDTVKKWVTFLLIGGDLKRITISQVVSDVLSLYGTWSMFHYKLVPEEMQHGVQVSWEIRRLLHDRQTNCIDRGISSKTVAFNGNNNKSTTVDPPSFVDTYEVKEHGVYQVRRTLFLEYIPETKCITLVVEYNKLLH